MTKTPPIGKLAAATCCALVILTAIFLAPVASNAEAGVNDPVIAGAAPVLSAGFQLVTLYCADCHAVGPAGEGKHATAPRFRDLHLRYDVEALEEALVEGLVAHPDMPEFEFDTDQAQAIIAYLKALEPAAVAE